MIMETQNQQPAVNVYPNGYGNGGMGDGAFGGGWFSWIILFFFFMMFAGWGNNGNAMGNNGGVAYVPYANPYMMGAGNGYNIQQSFDQAALVNGINGIQNQLQTGFSNAEVSRCNQQANLLAQLNNNQNATNTQLQNLNMGLQNCCCENRAATADLKYTVATEACADRAAVGDAFQALSAQNAQNMNAMMTQFNNGMQSLKDDFFQYQMSCKDDRIADLQRQLTATQIAGMVNGSRDAVIANNELQTAALEQYLAPTPRPAYIVQNPNCCANQYYNNGCCGRG